jgi:aspartate kinase
MSYSQNEQQEMKRPDYVMKYGGSSLANAMHVKKIADSFYTESPVVVVLSAIGHTTDALEALAYLYGCGEQEKGEEQRKELEQFYYNWCKEMFGEIPLRVVDLLENTFNQLASALHMLPGSVATPGLLAIGEQLSVALVGYYLKSVGIKHQYLPALEILWTDEEGKPDEALLKQRIQKWFEHAPHAQVVLTEGFICRDARGEVSNLKRGGSDYTASLLGAALEVSEIVIWSDIDGFHNNDPRYVEGTRTLRKMSFDEAAELAYFGASIMHPSSVQPARAKGIPVRLKNTLHSNDQGTLITNCLVTSSLRAIAAKSGIFRLQIRSARMLQAYGFLRRVFAVFERYKVPIDAITTSEVSVSVTIDSDEYMEELIQALQELGEVTCYANQAIVCLVGDMGGKKTGVLSKVLHALNTVPIHMVSYGGSANNVTLVLDDANKQRALQLLHTKVFIS